MSGKFWRTSDYLAHMHEAVRRITTYVKNLDRAAFEQDIRTQDAVIRNLEIVGEAARNVLEQDPAFASEHPEIPWALAYRTRNALSHGYAEVDLMTVWSTVQRDLPELQKNLLPLLASTQN